MSLSSTETKGTSASVSQTAGPSASSVAGENAASAVSVQSSTISGTNNYHYNNYVLSSAPSSSSSLMNCSSFSSSAFSASLTSVASSGHTMELPHCMDQKDMKEELEKCLKMNPSLKQIARIPGVLELLRSLWEDQELQESLSTQASLTEMYERMVCYIQKQFLLKVSNSQITPKSGLKAIQKHPITQLLNRALGTLAWGAMQKKQLILSPVFLGKCLNAKDYPECKDQKEYDVFLEQLFKEVGLLKGIGAPKTSSIEQSYYFVHFTFQDFFVAKYLAEGLSMTGNTHPHYQEAYEFIRHHKYDRGFMMVLMFTAGLLSGGSSQSAVTGITRFWEAIEGSSSRDLLGLGHLALVMRCLNEAKCDKRIGTRNKFLEELGRYAQETFYNGNDEVCFTSTGFIELMQENPRIIDELKFLDFLISECKSKVSKDKRNAATILGRLGRSNEKVIKALIDILGDEDASVREEVSEVLGKVGNGNKEVIGALIGALSDEEARVREEAVEALGKVGQGNEEAIRALVGALGDMGERAKMIAAEALGRMNQGNEGDIKTLIDALIDALCDEDKWVRKEVVKVLQKVSQGNKEAIKALIGELSNEDNWVRREVVKLLQTVGQGNEEAKKAFIRALDDKDKEVRRCAVEALGEVGQGNKEATKALIAALSDVDKCVRREVVKVLQKVGQGNEEATKALIAALSDGDEGVRAEVVKALVKMGQGNEEAIKALVTKLDGQNVMARWEVRDALRTLPLQEPLVAKYFQECSLAQNSKFPVWLLKWILVKGAVMQCDEDLHKVVFYDESVRVEYQLDSSQLNLLTPLKRACAEMMRPYNLPSRCMISAAISCEMKEASVSLNAKSSSSVSAMRFSTTALLQIGTFGSTRLPLAAAMNSSLPVSSNTNTDTCVLM